MGSLLSPQMCHTCAHLIDFTCAVPSPWNSFPLALPCWLLPHLRSQLICCLFTDRSPLSLADPDTTSGLLVYLQCRLPLSSMRAFNLSMLFTTVPRGSSPELKDTEKNLGPLQTHRREVTSLRTGKCFGAFRLNSPAELWLRKAGAYGLPSTEPGT